MTRRIIELSLLAMLLLGGFQAWTSARERSKLQAEFERLIKATGDFTIGDPTKVHILAIPTGEPLCFAWRIYLPPNYNLVAWRNSRWMGGSALGAKSKEFVARVRIVEKDGVLEEFDTLTASRRLEEIGDSKLADFLRGRWDQILVDQAGAGGVVAIEPDDYFTLLSLTIPKELQAEARPILSGRESRSSFPVLLSFCIGTPKPKPMTPPSGP